MAKIAAYSYQHRNTLRGQLLFVFHLIFHPLDGFWDLKHEHRGSRKAATVIVALLVLNSIIKTQFTGYLYNPYYDGISLNIFNEFATTVGTFALWCIANWSLTTLMDGEGSIGDIFVASAYALAPLVIIGIPLALISNVMPNELADVYTLLNSVAVLWSGGLMLAGTMVVHQYSMTRTVITAALIVVAMAVMVFLGLLFFNLISQLVNFVISVYWELALRY